jgi:hypothetical protein
MKEAFGSYSALLDEYINFTGKHGIKSIAR